MTEGEWLIDADAPVVPLATLIDEDASTVPLVDNDKAIVGDSVCETHG
jgi:hypothetical protein